MFRFGLISDTHITKGGTFVEHVYDRGVKIINNEDVKFVVHAGDVTDIGTLDDYELALEKLSNINKPLFLVPGNHDSKNVGDHLWEEMIGERSFVYEESNLLMIGVDSSVPDMNEGRIGSKTLQWVRNLLGSVGTDVYKIVVFHHQLLPIPFTGRERSVIQDSGDVLKTLLDEDVQLVINGHRHISNSYIVTDGSGEMVVINAGTMSCKKTRYREQQSIAIVEIENTNRSRNKVILRVFPLRVEPIVELDRIHTFAPRPNSAQLRPYAKIIHISNTHFTKGDFDERAFAKATHKINREKPDLIVHTGDVTFSSRIEEFELAKDYLSDFEAPLLVVPGKRDMMSLGWEVFPEHIGELDPMFENHKMKVIGINSCVVEDESGTIGRRTMRRVIREFAKEEKRLTVTAFHHQIIPTPRTKHDTVLNDSGDVLAAFSTGNVDIILHGYKHIGYAVQVGKAVISNAGTLSSHRYLTKERNTYNQLNIFKHEKGFYVVVKEVDVLANREKVLGDFMIDVKRLLPEQASSALPFHTLRNERKTLPNIMNRS